MKPHMYVHTHTQRVIGNVDQFSFVKGLVTVGPSYDRCNSSSSTKLLRSGCAGPDFMNEATAVSTTYRESATGSRAILYEMQGVTY